ncbi:hypothetical protein [Microcoleus sp. herbarium2]|uniref:hypothetical protein n=1 Tax=Microcoleus sp. herbarium2 TaxID=3055433 RepID=UPI002FD179CA
MINLLCFNQQQQIVFRRVISAFIFSLTFVLIGYFVIALPLPLFNTAESRLIFALRCQIFPVLMLFAGIVAVGKGRFSSAAINPLANAESEAMRINLRYLSSTNREICAVYCRKFNPLYLFRYLQHQADSNFGNFVCFRKNSVLDRLSPTAYRSSF